MITVKAVRDCYVELVFMGDKNKVVLKQRANGNMVTKAKIPLGFSSKGDGFNYTLQYINGRFLVLSKSGVLMDVAAGRCRDLAQLVSG